MLAPYGLARNLVSNGQYMEFIDDGGYQRPDHWLSAGWAFVQDHKISAPMYWFKKDSCWHQYTLGGYRPLDADSPVIHVSYYEADAYARWKGCRLPTEFEWEHAAVSDSIESHHQSDADRSIDHTHHPARTSPDSTLQFRDLFGCGWQWTRSDYAAYPGYQPPAGAIGEYNGKFMSGNYVLRGGSCATPPGHTRVTYRNFFAPTTRWQFTTIRLASDDLASSEATGSL